MRAYYLRNDGDNTYLIPEDLVSEFDSLNELYQANIQDLSPEEYEDICEKMDSYIPHIVGGELASMKLYLKS